MPHANGLRERIASLFSRTLNLDVPSVESDLFETEAKLDRLLAESRFGPAREVLEHSCLPWAAARAVRVPAAADHSGVLA